MINFDAFEHGKGCAFWDKGVREACDCGLTRLQGSATGREDTELLNVAQTLLLGADFRWGEPETQVVVLALPKGVRVGSDLRTILRACREVSR